MNASVASSSSQRVVSTLVLFIGLAAVAWVGWGFVGTSPLALAMTTVIGAVYLLGAWELRQFRAATSTLTRALASCAQPVDDLPAWLARLHPGLQGPVRQRIEGERGAMPGPALTPYYVGLLVMLGMMGTFLGMVVTFKGAVFALEGSSDLVAIRAALAEPIKGLGLSFGTSVAGVAASAMLGLLSALSRRERIEATRALDACIATAFKPFTAAQRRDDTVQALQAQAQTLPRIVDGLQALMDAMDRRTEHLQQQLLAQQRQFHEDMTSTYTDLARTVGQSLNDSLGQGARAAGEAIRPVVAEAMADVAQSSRLLQQGLASASQAQQAALDAALQATLNAVEQRTQALLVAAGDAAGQVADQAGRHVADALEAATRVIAQSEDLVNARRASEARWTQVQAERMDQLAEVWRRELQVLRDDEAAHARAAVARLDQLQGAVAGHLAKLGASLEAPIARLLQTAADVPQAASEVIGQLRREMGALAERDNEALAERQVLMQQLSGVIEGVQGATRQQAQAIEAVTTQVSAHLTASAVELASVGESFQAGVAQFSAGSSRLIEQLERIESALSQSMARSDEQLAYYVAQAREVIDLSISAQQGIVDDLRRLHGHTAAGGA